MHFSLLSGGVVVLAVVGTIGCAQAPIVQSDLPIRRVVVYRNGVAYFERSGHVDKDEVRFKMRQSEVGDFLATLAVMEQGDSSVRSAAFPLKPAEHEPKVVKGDDKGDEQSGADKDEKSDDREKHDKKDSSPGDEEQDDLQAMRTVVLSLDGRSHDLQVGYVAAAPVWRPSYRLVVLPGGRANLQAWGIVQNMSGEDWTGVRLSLVTGAPLAFDARLGTPSIPDRPVVTDQGEIIASMPKGETSLEQREDKKSPSPVAAAPASPGSAAPPPPPADEDKEGGTGTRAKGEEGPMTPSGAVRLQEKGVQPSLPRNIQSLAAIAVQGGTTRYDIPTIVTVPDKSATMVMLLARPVKGEALYLFAPDDGVQDSAWHPFHVVRFENGTAGVLERGPIAVFEQGSFLGQGLIDPLPAGASATVPFALERAIGVEKQFKTDIQGTRVAKIENGNLFLEHDLVFKTTYAVQNGSEDAVKLLVKHPRANGARLFDPPAGTEDNTGSGSALVPMAVPAHGKQELVIDERTAQREWADWFGAGAAKAVKAYLLDPRSDKAVVAQLSAAWPLHDQIDAKQSERAKLQLELSQLAQEAAEKRSDLRAIEKNDAARALRKKLTDRLAAISSRQDTLTAQNIQLGQDLSELQLKWRDAIRAITLTETPPPKP
jgi:hypothetical protein